MKAQTDDPRENLRRASQPRDLETMRSRRRIVIAGWALLLIFVAVVAWSGGIQTNVRLYQAAYACGFVGFVLLIRVVAWRSDVTGVGRWGWWLLGCILIRVALIGTQPSDDLYRCVWEGRVQVAGHNPYAHAPNSDELIDLRDDTWQLINHPDYPAIYPPIAQAQFAALALVHPSTHLVKALHVAWDVLVVAVLGSCLRNRGLPPHGAIVYGLCPLVISAFAVEGHVDSLMLLFLALAVHSMGRKRIVLAGAMLGAAVAAKTTAIVFVPWLVIRHPRAAGAAIGVVVACYLPYAAAGTGLFESILRFTRESEFFSLLAALGIADFETVSSRRLIGLVLAGVLLFLVLRRREFTRFALPAAEMTVVLMPIVHYWYLTMVVMFVTFQRRWCWIAAAAAMVVYFEAERARSLTGTWSMPVWVPTAVWGVFGAALVIEWFAGRVDTGAREARTPVSKRPSGGRGCGNQGEDRLG